MAILIFEQLDTTYELQGDYFTPALPYSPKKKACGCLGQGCKSHIDFKSEVVYNDTDNVNIIYCSRNILETPLFYVYYAGIYGLLLSTLLPIMYILKSKESFRSLRIQRLGKRQVVVILVFVVFSIAGQLIPLHMKSIEVRYHLLGVCIIPLILTTFFEELLFRGFMQTRFEKIYGVIQF